MLLQVPCLLQLKRKKMKVVRKLQDAGMHMHGQQPQGPYFVSSPPAIPIKQRQSAAVGVILIILGCLGILCNAIELAISTGLSQVYQNYDYDYYRRNYYDTGNYYYSNSYRYRYRSETISTGFIGHGIWCGIMVSTRRQERTQTRWEN